MYITAARLSGFIIWLCTPQAIMASRNGGRFMNSGGLPVRMNVGVWESTVDVCCGTLYVLSMRVCASGASPRLCLLNLPQSILSKQLLSLVILFYTIYTVVVI